MEVKVYNRYTEALIFSCEAESFKKALESRANLACAYLAGADFAGAYLAGADLSEAYLAGANLAGAYLSRADLSDADLSGANLSGAYLAGANFARADLVGANLAGACITGASGLNPDLTDVIRILLEQTNPIRGFKLIKKNGEGPFNGGINYLEGDSFEAPTINTDETIDCGEGIALATLSWCLNEWRDGCRILIMEFDRSDENPLIIPIFSDGKFRVKKCRRTGEVSQERINKALGRA